MNSDILFFFGTHMDALPLYARLEEQILEQIPDVTINGSICAVKLETIEDPLMQEIRYLDKLVDELAKGKPMEKILRKG